MSDQTWAGLSVEVSFELNPECDVLRYSGEHHCRTEDHDQDKQVREYFRNRLREGQKRFLVDVRDLYIMFLSGRGDLFNSWPQGDVKVAVLWKPVPPGHWGRLGSWDLMSENVNHKGLGTLRFFIDEDEARTFLVG